MKLDEPIIVQGQIRVNARDEENPRAEITAIDVQLLSEVRKQKTSELALRIDAERLEAERARELKALLGRHPGACAVTLRAVISSETETTVRIPIRVTPADELLDSARRLGFEVELR